MSSMPHIYAQITEAQRLLADLLSGYLKDGDTSRDQYIRYLSFQYHMTRGVQRYFLSIAAHPDLARRRRLRDFLVNFANEEELHYLVAANDLHQMGEEPLPEPLDVRLWHAFFRSVVESRPFIRLGAATVLENISAGPARPWVKKALSAPFMNRGNTKFLVLHQHETLPHGDQILDAIETADLDCRQFGDLLEGARIGTVLYLRMAEWAVRPTSIARLADLEDQRLDAAEAARIAAFDMAELQLDGANGHG